MMTYLTSHLTPLGQLHPLHLHNHKIATVIRTANLHHHDTQQANVFALQHSRHLTDASL